MSAQPIIESKQIGGTYNIQNNIQNKKQNSTEYNNKFGLNQTGVFPAIKRIIAIGDIHGDFNALQKHYTKQI